MTALLDEVRSAAEAWTAGPQPRPHQQNALDALAAGHAAGHARMQTRMACGTGKTFVGRWHAAAIAADVTLVLCPSLALVAQTLREWRRASGPAFEALVVCSDPSTSAGAAERGAVDGHLGNTWCHRWYRLDEAPTYGLAALMDRERWRGSGRYILDWAASETEGLHLDGGGPT
ncbi:DEAD/DEAH box helicase family protein [Actinomadura sp. 3N407]|uniref:DEAD/DEAH box helicase family protein n=1 Tax=Actinomadura sp. 3N407 TaxID=3457423 RepID=UPI003FCE1100